MPDDFDDFVTPAAPKLRGQGRVVHQPVGAQWSLDRLPEVESLYQTSFKRKLPLANRGQGSVHNRLGYDHRQSADISLNPATPEGQQFVEQLKKANVPFLAFDRAIPGVSTSPHIHLGFPSKRTQQRFGVGVQQKGKPADDFDRFVIPATEQSQPPGSLSRDANKPATSPATGTAAPSLTDALDALTANTNRATEKLKRQAARQPPRNPLMERFAQQRVIDQSQRQQRQQMETEARADLQSERGAYGAPTGRGVLRLFSDPIGKFGELLKSDDEIIRQRATEKLKAQRIAQDPEVTESRKLYGQMSAPRRVVQRPLEKAGAGILKLGGGLASGLGIAPNQLSEWMNRRGELIETAASLPPLAEEQSLTSLITGEQELKDVDVGAVEKIATGVTDLGLGLGQIILLKRASKLSFPNLLALEAAAKNSDKPLTEQAARAAEGYALGVGLERLTSRTANAALSGIPTGTQTGYEVAQGRMLPTDALIQTGIQTATGAILPPARPRQRGAQIESHAPGHLDPTFNSRPIERFSIADHPDILSAGQRALKFAERQGAVTFETWRQALHRYMGASDLTEPYMLELYNKVRGGEPIREYGEQSEIGVIPPRPPLTTQRLVATPPVGEAGWQTSSLPVSTTPESPATLAAQFDALRTGRREAVLIPPGTPPPPRPRGLTYLDTPVGTFYFDPRRISVPEIQQAVRDNTYGQLLGHVEPKPALGEPTAIVTARQGNTEVQSSAVSPARAAEQARVTQAQNPDAQVEVGGPKLAQQVITDRLKPETSIKNAATTELRRDLDLLELEGPEVKTWQQTIDNAKSRKLDEQAEQVASEVIANKRQLSEEDEAGIQLRMRELENQWEDTYRRDPQSPELTDLKQRLDNLTRASKEGGTPLARALNFRRSFIDKDYKLISVVQRAEKAAERKLSDQEFQRYEQQVARVRKLEAELAGTSEVEPKTLQRDVDRIARREGRTETRQALDDEFVQLKAQFAQARAETRNMQASGLAGLDPEGRLTGLIGRMARNRIRAGVTDAAQLVDDIHAAIVEYLPDVTRREVQDAISGYGRESQRVHSDEAKQLAQVRSALKRLSAQEDIAAGRRLSPQDKRRQTQLQKQEAEIKRRLAQQDFTKPPPRPKPTYTKETRQLEQEIQNLKNKLDLEIERHRPGHHWRTLSALRKSWMLSGLSTQTKNILGTGGYQAFDELARIPAVITDAAVAGVTRQRGISTSPTQALDAILHAYQTGGREAKEILQRGATQEQLERHQFSEIDTGVKLIDFTGNIVFRFMSASDRVFYNYAYKRNLTDRARVQAKNEGAGSERARELADTPPEELDAAAKHDALVATFNNNNRLSNAIKGARAQLGPKANFAIDLVMPFDRTPTNVVARILEASPVGFAKAATGGYKQSPAKLAKSIIDKKMAVEEQRQFSQTVGRATAGTAIIALGWALGDKLFEVEKYKVYLKLGKQRIDLTSISPLGNLLALGARYRQNYDDGKPWEAVKTTARIPLDQPLLQTGSTLTDVIKDPERSLTNQAARTTSSFIPFGGAVRDVAKALDPEEKRRARTFTERIQQGIPVWRQSLPVGADDRQQKQRAAMVEQYRQGQLDDTAIDDAIASDAIPKSVGERIKREGGMTAQQARFSNKPNMAALDEFERLDPPRREHLQEIMTRKAWSLLHSDSLTTGEKLAVQDRLDRLGIYAKKPTRARRVVSPFGPSPF